MSEYLKYFFENDPLKTAIDVVHSANFGRNQNDSEGTISLSFLFWTAVFLALSKTLYGDAGFTFLQHFWTTLFIVLILYVSAGIFMTIAAHIASAKLKYAWVNNKLRCFLTCFLATTTVSLFLVFFSDSITRASVWFVECFYVPLEWVGTIADWGPATLFSLIGCVAIFWMKAVQGEAIFWRWLPAYWTLTAITFYQLAYDRGWFFDNVMRYSFKIVPS